MSERTYVSASAYRFGFGGQEKDDEVSGLNNSYTAEYWQYDPRLGKRWNVDPLVKPWESSFATFANNPIYYNDPTGSDAEGDDKKKGGDKKAGGDKTKKPDCKGCESNGHGTKTPTSKPKSEPKGKKTPAPSKKPSPDPTIPTLPRPRPDKSKVPAVRIRIGNTPGNFEDPPFLNQTYGSRKVKFYNTGYDRDGKALGAVDEPDNYAQIQVRRDDNWSYSTLIMKQKIAAFENDFKLEATTSIEFGLSYYKLIKDWGWFTVSADFSGTVGMTVANPQFINNSPNRVYQPWNTTKGYTPVGVSTTAIARVDATILRYFTVFVAGNVHHYQGATVKTTAGDQKLGYVGSAEITVGAGFTFGYKKK